MTLMMLNGQIKLVLLEFPDASSTFTYLEPCEVIPEISTHALKKKLLKIFVNSNNFLICSQLMRDAFFFLFFCSPSLSAFLNVYINACFHLCCLYVTIGS